MSVMGKAVFVKQKSFDKVIDSIYDSIMKINNKHYRSIWLTEDGIYPQIIDQTKLPHVFEIMTLKTVEEVYRAIQDMNLRGAPLIGAAGAYGIALAMYFDSSDTSLQEVCSHMVTARPTAVNLAWACDIMEQELNQTPEGERASRAYELAAEICDEDVAINSAIGDYGLQIIEEIASKKEGETVHILTHCNAGWLATVDWGTALAPIYKAHDKGIPVHVWVDETRPRSQGANLTSFELSSHGVPHTLIVDNAGGHLMQHGMVDLCFVGTDRTTRHGDVCNKIGTYLKALAAHDNGVPFYVCLPSPTFDWSMDDAFQEIPIELRSGSEVTEITGAHIDTGELTTIRICSSKTDGDKGNFGFDVTPAKYVTGLITERGVCKANTEDIAKLFPEKG